MVNGRSYIWGWPIWDYQLHETSEKIRLPMDPGPGNKDRDPGGQVKNHERGMASRCQTVALEKWSYQDREDGKSVTPFFSEFVP